MRSFLNDFKSFISFKKNEKFFDTGFFCENKFIFQYLEKYISKKTLNKKILIISFEKIQLPKNKNIKLFVFKSNFFRELFFLTLRLKFFYSSTPDLNNSIFKKSKFSNCKYIYLQHSPISLIAGYNQEAFKSFDAIQAINEYQLIEIKEISKKYNLKIKAFRGKYLFFKNKLSNTDNEKKRFDVLIAPSWNTKFYELKCHLKLSEHLRKNDISYQLRPHPMSIKKREVSFEELEKNMISINSDDNLNFNNHNFLISDWSGIFIEYAFLKNKKCFLINTPRKILNHEYTSFSSKSIEVDQRNNLAFTYNVDEIKKLSNDIFNFKTKKIFTKIENYSEFKSKFY